MQVKFKARPELTMESTDQKIAHLRIYPNSKSCVLTFPLALETNNGNFQKKEVRSYTKLSGTLQDLKKQIIVDILCLNKADKENEECIFKLPSEQELVVDFLKDGGKSYRESIQLEDFIKITEGKSLKVVDSNFPLILNAPLVRVMRLPQVIYSGYPVELIEFKHQFLDLNASKFIWSKSLDKEKWKKIGEGFQFAALEEEVGHFLKLCCLPYSQNKVKGPICEVVSDYEVMELKDFPQCPFEKRHLMTGKKLSGKKFRVVTYNVLADRYVDQIKFPYCPLKALGIHYRKHLIMKELRGYNADIICLQEMDESHFKSYYKEELKNAGFKSFFNRKGNCIPEGLVCSFRTSRYKLLEVKQLVMRNGLELNRFKEISRHLEMNEEVKAEFLKQFTSIQSMVLEDKSTKRILVVGNTHLFYHPDANHIRLLQAFMACQQLKWLSDKIMRENRTSKVAIVFCGDFNSHYEKSLYDFMTSGSVDPMHEDCLKISSNGHASLSHKLHLKSACGKPTYTNYTDSYKGCLDYIFIESLKLEVENLVPVDTKEELEQYIGLPNEIYPSDHLALVVDLNFNK